jgi:FkbM family methyltransferase
MLEALLVTSGFGAIESNFWRNMRELLIRAISLTNFVLEKIFGVRVVLSKGTFDQARIYLLTSNRIDTVIDGGANEGQWALRTIGKLPNDCKLISFEPNVKSFEILRSKAKNYVNWSIHNLGLSEKPGTLPIYISSNNEMSSSFLQPGGHLESFPTVSFPEVGSASVIRLDELNSLSTSRGIYLKLDVQGYEKFAYDGCSGILDKIKVIEIETSLGTMYQGDSPHYELIPKLISDGFLPYAFSTPARDKLGRCTYVDVLLVRE